MRRLRYSVPYIAGKKLPKDSDPAPRGAGPFSRASARCGRHFNPPAPCGAGRRCCTICRSSGDFNPPAPCGAGPYPIFRALAEELFQSTRPLRGGTQTVRREIWPGKISIHPPLAGRDFRVSQLIIGEGNFNPPAPCGAGHPGHLDYNRVRQFQSTRPLRGGTSPIKQHPYMSRFQSTRPLRGGTAILHKKTVQNIAYCTKSAFTLAVLSGFLALMRPFFLPNVHKFRCEPSEESLLAPRSHAYTIRTPSG